VAESVKYRVGVAGLQASVQFDVMCTSHKVGGSVVVVTGRPVPGEEATGQNGEGVAIVLSSQAVEAWEGGDSRWKAWSSRLVSAVLKVGCGSRDVLHVLSCYAPTFAASIREDNVYDI